LTSTTLKTDEQRRSANNIGDRKNGDVLLCAGQKLFLLNKGGPPGAPPEGGGEGRGAPFCLKKEKEGKCGGGREKIWQFFIRAFYDRRETCDARDTRHPTPLSPV
jgi:hypothetical protein